LGLIGLCALPLSANAQDYPTKPIRLVVPFPPGGPSDIISRVLGQKMQELLGQLIIIDNRAGAGGVLGIDNVAKSEPDGYSIGLSSAGALGTLARTASAVSLVRGRPEQTARSKRIWENALPAASASLRPRVVSVTKWVLRLSTTWRAK